jgi:predicted metal-dependent hydrolase
LAYKYTIRRSHRAKKTRIIVTAEKIEVVAPLRVSERKIHAFVTSKQDWIETATDKVLKNRQALKKMAPEKYRDGASVPFRGEAKKIQLKFTASKTVNVVFDQQIFTVELPTDRSSEDNHQAIRLALIDWMQNQAVKDVKSMIDEYAEKYNLYPRRVRIKTQKSRWGSCGIHNDINLNWLLMLAPPKVMEYVVIHELCHIQERNHSANFWQLVEKHCPKYREHRLWLKQNSRSVMQGL